VAAAPTGKYASERERQRMKRCEHGASVKILYFRRPPRRPSDISLCPMAYLTAVGHKLMSDGHSDSPRIYGVTFDGCPGPSDIRESSYFYCFTVVMALLAVGGVVSMIESL
jgi:hypothetical protein